MAQWRDVPGFPGYQASDDGQIIRTFVGGNGRKPGIVKGTISNGYRNVPLCVPGRPPQTVGAHVMVCLAFHGAKPSPAHEVAHWDGDKDNNRPGICAGQPQRETRPTAGAMAMTSSGSDAATAKLTEDQAREIARRAVAGDPQRAIAADFGISQITAQRIATGEGWKHLDITRYTRLARTEKRGSRANGAKLTEADIPRIFALAAAGKSQRKIATEFSVNQSLIWLVLARKIWRHVQ